MSRTAVVGTRRAHPLVGYAALTALSVFGSSAIGVALPVVARELALGEAATSWVLAAFMLTFPIGTVLFGRLVDLRGQRYAFRVGMALFVGGSVVGAATLSYPLLLAGRLLQGLGSGVIPTLSSAKVSEGLSGPARARALGALTAAVGVSSGLSPLVGGSLTEGLGWRAVIALPALAVVTVPYLDGQMHGGVHTAGRIDLRGLVAVTAAVAAGLLLLQSSSLALGGARLSAVLAVGGVATTFVAWNVGARPDGFLPRALVTDSRVVRPSLAALCLLAAYLGCVLLVPLMLSGSAGWSSLQIGTAMVPGAAVGVLATRLVPRILLTRGRRVAALTVIASSAVGVAAVALFADQVVLPLVGVAFAAGGSMGGQVAFLDAAMRPDGDPLQGSSVGVFFLFLFSGGALGAVLAGAVAEMSSLRSSAGVLVLFPVVAVAVTFLARPAGTAGATSTVRTPNGSGRSSHREPPPGTPMT